MKLRWEPCPRFPFSHYRWRNKIEDTLTVAIATWKSGTDVACETINERGWTNSLKVSNTERLLAGKKSNPINRFLSMCFTTWFTNLVLLKKGIRKVSPRRGFCGRNKRYRRCSVYQFGLKMRQLRPRHRTKRNPLFNYLTGGQFFYTGMREEVINWLTWLWLGCCQNNPKHGSPSWDRSKTPTVWLSPSFLLSRFLLGVRE